MLCASTPLAVVKKPPATTSPFASDATALTSSFKPAPSGDHDDPFQRAMLIVATPPFGSLVRVLTVPLMPVPSCDHDAPFQRAMLFAATPPAVVKLPPATRSPFGSVVRA